MRVLALVTVVLLASVFVSASEEKQIVKSGANEKFIHLVTFMAEKGDPGHAFVLFAAEDEDKAMSSESAVGFYPEVPAGAPDAKLKYLAVFGTPGKLEDDAKTHADLKLSVRVSAEAYSRAAAVWKKWSDRADGKYHALFSDCVTFTNEVATALGLTTPVRVLKPWPEDYLRALMESN